MTTTPTPATPPPLPPAPAALAERVLARLARVPAPPAGPLVLAVDGRSGTGKTDLAAVLRRRTGAPVVHMDDLYPGWDGLAAAVDLLGGLLERLRRGAVVEQPVWDWTREAYTRTVELPTSGLLVLEGVGAGCAGPVDLLVELTAAPAVRRERALARDGQTYLPHWERWAAQEAALFARRPLHPDLRWATGPGD
ncbi:dephospho-CoA kinase [Kineococcus sp. LSe6-4]|uniref:Dephospho-CoA kinase n=1 Tax=Kineococcus halophytocola TaxID=3234027 RepID=A0ABV4GZN3_9ACTN